MLIATYAFGKNKQSNRLRVSRKEIVGIKE